MKHRMSRTTLLLAVLGSFLVHPVPASSQSGGDTQIQQRFPARSTATFEARSLRGIEVSRDSLRGGPSVLVITPDIKAAQASRQWIQMLENELNVADVGVRQILVLDPDQYESDQVMMRQARRSFPREAWAHTWIVADVGFLQHMGLEEFGDEVTVLVLDSSAQIIAQVIGEPTIERFRHVDATLLSATSAPAS
jgi:hypothetical protein